MGSASPESPQPSVDASGPSAESAASSEAQPSGVGGWLALLVFILLFFKPIRDGWRLYRDFTTAVEDMPVLATMSEWQTYEAASWAAFAVFAALSIYGGWGLAKGRDWRVVRRAIAVLWVSGPVTSIVALALSVACFGGFDLNGEFARMFVLSAAGAAIWTAYLLKSVRVRNTYARTG
jgi:hypothetical protein